VNAISTALCEPLLGVLLVSLLNISWSQYQMLVHMVRKGWNATTSKFEPLTLHWPALRQQYSTTVLPRLVAPFKHVKQLWKQIFQQSTRYSPINIPNVVAQEWLITDIIEYVCGNAFLLGLFRIPVDTLEVILKVSLSSSC
jgi:hypothetical protein